MSALIILIGIGVVLWLSTPLLVKGINKLTDMAFAMVTDEPVVA